MQAEAADKIDRGIGKATPRELSAESQRKRAMTAFRPYEGKMRMPGTGFMRKYEGNRRIRFFESKGQDPNRQVDDL